LTKAMLCTLDSQVTLYPPDCKRREVRQRIEVRIS
jgi:hypothetical protein